MIIGTYVSQGLEPHHAKISPQKEIADFRSSMGPKIKCIGVSVLLKVVKRF